MSATLLISPMLRENFPGAVTRVGMLKTCMFLTHVFNSVFNVFNVEFLTVFIIQYFQVKTSGGRPTDQIWDFHIKRRDLGDN